MTTLSSYEAQSRDPMRCYQLFDSWKSSNKPAYTWATIIGVLESDAVNEVAVADSVREWLMHEKLSTVTF